MSFDRIAIRLILTLTLLIAIGVILFTLLISGPRTVVSWATIAASLVVIASSITAWTGRKALELQQDVQQPYPYPTVDAASRYALLQLCVRNAGGTSAHDIKLDWDQQLLDSQGKQVKFMFQEEAPDIPVLLPGENASVLIDESSRFFSSTTDARYSGYVRFKDVYGSDRKHRFYLDIEHHRGSLYYDKEEPKTHYRLQELPKKLDELTSELQKSRKKNSPND